MRTAKVFREKSGIDVRTGHRVTTIDRVTQTVHGIATAQTHQNDFEIPYDRLLIATGAEPIIPDRPGFDLPGVVTVKTLDGAKAIKTLLSSRSVKKAMILGMGYIAMEMAEALRAREVEVVMAKPRTALLPWLAADLTETVRLALEANDVRLLTGFTTDRIEQITDRLNVIAENGQSESADMVVVATGVRPNSQLAVEAGLDLGPARSIAVDRQMLTSDPNIYAAGDCADTYHVVTDQKSWIPLALRANRSGWAVADHLCGKAVYLPGIVGTAVFKVFDLQVGRTGLTAQEASKAGFDPASVTIQTASRAHSHPGSSPIQVHMIGDKGTGRLLGAQMVGREGVAHRINAPAVALHAQMTVAQFSQSDLAYAPPFGPTWDPLLVAANQLEKILSQ